METEELHGAELSARWTAALGVLIGCGVLINGLLSGSALAPRILETLVLFLIVFAVYACTLYPPAGGLALGLAVSLCLLYAWAVRQAPSLGIAIGVLASLVGAAEFEQRRQLRRRRRMEQVLSDLTEEQTVKDQAIALARQGREALARKLSRYAQLQIIAEELSNMTDLGAVAPLAVERAFDLIGKSDVCLLFLVDREHQVLSLFASRKREARTPIRTKHGDQFDRHVLRTRRPLLVNDVRRDFRFSLGAAPDREISSVIGCPLVLGHNPEGVLRLDSAQPNAYTQDDLRFLDILVDLVSSAVTNAQLFARMQQLAMTDGLTGLTLRRPLLEQLTRELIRAGRSQEAVSVLMLDVDHFKRYNDTLGHTAGDLVLRDVAEVLRAVAPPGSTSSRYGGEEFVVLLPRVDRAEAADIAENIRRLVEQGRARTGRAVAREEPRGRRAGRAGLSVTISVGVATFPHDAKAELELIRVADQRLYEAKRGGRNRVQGA